MKIYWNTLAGALIALLALSSCGGAERVGPTSYEDGLVTTVRETSDGTFKIEDEKPVSQKSASAIIAKYADNTVDTIPLSEAQQIMADSTAQAKNDSTSRHHNSHYHRRSSLVSVAYYGYMGYMLGRSRSYGPSPGVYMDQRTYQRVNNTTGSRFRNATSRSTTSKPSKSKSGYGSSRSTRSYGG